jgi:NitT/TauT family transport system substrate-binding protein
MVRWIQHVAILSLLALSQSVLYAQSEPDHLKVIVGTGQLGTSNTFIADAEGYFAAQNIEIEYVTVSSTNDAEALALLLNGEVDVMQAGWTPGIFNAIARGAELKVVGVASYNDADTCPYAAFVARGGENVDAESLRGRSIAASNGIAIYYLDRWLGSNNMSIDDVSIEIMQGGPRIEALDNGMVDAAYLTEPNLSVTVAQLGFEPLVGLGEIVPDSSLAALMFGPNMLNRQDDLPVRFLTAYLQGSRQFNEGPTERNIEILSPLMEMEPDQLLQTCWISFREDGSLNTDFALDYVNWLNEQGLLDEPLELDEFYDPSYAQQAYERLNTMTADPTESVTAQS